MSALDDLTESLRAAADDDADLMAELIDRRDARLDLAAFLADLGRRYPDLHNTDSPVEAIDAAADLDSLSRARYQALVRRAGRTVSP